MCVRRLMRTSWLDDAAGSVVCVKPPAFDFAPLHDEIDARAAREFESRLSQAPEPIATRRAVVLNFVGLLLWLIACVGTVVATVAVPNDTRNLDEPLERFTMGLVLVIPVTIVFSLIFVPLLSLMGRGKPTRFARYRLAQFAEANGMNYSSRMVVNERSLVFDVVRGDQPLPVEIGNLHISPYENVQATVKDFAFGYVAVRLPHAMPHIVLDATSNDIAISLGESIAQGQRQSLEGDFDDHFALYCAEGYERDALYLFTPDVMAHFIDGAAALDVEFRDDMLFFYSANQLSTPDENHWKLIERALGAVLPQLRSWRRWRDDGNTAEAGTAPSAHVQAKSHADTHDAPDDEPKLLISLRTAALTTKELKRKVPLWARLVMFGAMAYIAVLIGFAMALD